VPEAPTGLALSSAPVAQNSPVGTPVGTLSATDPDAGDSFTFTLVAGAGDTDNAAFAISGATVQTGPGFGEPGKSSYSLQVRVTDQSGLSFEQAFTISALPTPVPPEQPPGAPPAGAPPGSVSTVGAFDPATGTWYLHNTNAPGAPDAGHFAYGAPGWIPVA